MLFVKRDDLKIGMRLAKPIYNKKGVLLYDRDSKLTMQGIESVKNFGLIGIYVLEPAEPLPPMSEEDMEFERFQSVAEFTIEEELKNILKNKRQSGLYTFADKIISSYGRLDHKINFFQNLRSSEDFVYKHCSNVAILCAMISYQLKLRHDAQIECILAALVHDIGKLNLPKDQSGKQDIFELDEDTIIKCEYNGIDVIEQVFAATPGVKRNVLQAYNIHEAVRHHTELDKNRKTVIGAKILAVAEAFDSLTAMSATEEPKSQLMALKYLMQNEKYYDKNIVHALEQSVFFLSEGSSVELTNGVKGLVLSTNEFDLFKPVILSYADNRIMDLAQTLIFGDIEVVDLVKSFDNRHKIDPSAVGSETEEQSSENETEE